MTAPLTRADLAELREASRRPLFTSGFWIDAAERAIVSAAQGALAVFLADTFVFGAGEAWLALAVGAATGAGSSLLKSIAASGSGTGSASLAPSV
ncbi:holin [Microbacterium phage GardenState]|uniref:Holin n=1 Tax=Microbacterium phage GardenState TaxID=2776841 RepID=A0A7L8ZDP3_9CAUD|nr:holin [Microbacterium phage GardenState]